MTDRRPIHAGAFRLWHRYRRCPCYAGDGCTWMDCLPCKMMGNAHPSGVSNLFVGTSAGGISAMMLAAYDAPVDGLEQAIQFWEGSPAFLRQTRHALAGFAGATSLLSNRPLRQALQRVLGTRRLRDLPHKV